MSTVVALQVARWLGVSDAEDVLEKEGLNPEYEMGRQQGLGLGAKHLPHHKVRSGAGRRTACTACAGALRHPAYLSAQAVALTSGVEQRLGSKLKRTVERRREEEARLQQQPVREAALRRGFGAAQAGKSRHGKAALRQQHQHVPQHAAAAPCAAAAEEGSEEEEEGRGSAFGKGSRTAHLPSFTRAELLATSGSAQGKKRKRKKGGQGAKPVT